MSDPSTTGRDLPSDCPDCGSTGFVTRDTGPGEAECIDDDCPRGVFEVRDDGLRADGSGEQPDTRRCPKCWGSGARSVYVGTMGGAVECERCDGAGVVDS